MTHRDPLLGWTLIGVTVSSAALEIETVLREFPGWYGAMLNAPPFVCACFIVASIRRDRL